MKKVKVKAVLNNTKRTATIRRYCTNGAIIKYRTFPFEKEQWEYIKEWDSTQWLRFLIRNQTEYFAVNENT